MPMLPALRVGLYSTLSVTSIVLLGLCAARIHYTKNLPDGDPLNGGVKFHDPIVAELLSTSLFVIPWSWFVVFTIHKRREDGFISTFCAELVGSFIFWIMLLVGAAVATTTSNPPAPTKWGNLSSCNAGYIQCRVLTVLVAFAWINWVVLTILIIIAIGIAAANNGWNEPMHGRWDPRGSVYRDSRSGPQMSTRPTSYA